MANANEDPDWMKPPPSHIQNANSKWVSQAANMFPRKNVQNSHGNLVEPHQISINIELGRQLEALKNDKSVMGIVCKTMCHKDMVAYIQSHLHDGLFDELVLILEEVPPGVLEVPQKFKNFHAYAQHFQTVADRFRGVTGQGRVWIGGGWQAWVYASFGLVILASCVVGLVVAGVSTFAIGGFLTVFATGFVCTMFLTAYAGVSLSNDALANFRFAHMHEAQQRRDLPPPSRPPRMAMQINQDGTERYPWEYDPAMMPAARQAFQLRIGGAKARKQTVWLPTTRTVILRGTRRKVWENGVTREERVKKFKTVNGIRTAYYVKF